MHSPIGITNDLNKRNLSIPFTCAGIVPAGTSGSVCIGCSNEQCHNAERGNSWIGYFCSGEYLNPNKSYEPVKVSENVLV
jgi:hypothetical protein